MTDQQIQNVATGFLHVIRTQDSAFQQWQAVASSGDYAKIGAVIADTMHLATTPTQAEIQAMDAYIDQHLSDDQAAFSAARPTATVAMTICGVQGDGEEG
jgi:hypothetical protein